MKKRKKLYSIYKKEKCSKKRIACKMGRAYHKRNRVLGPLGCSICPVCRKPISSKCEICSYCGAPNKQIL